MENEPNLNFIINSLRNQISNQSMMIAEREALIETQGRELQKLKEEPEDTE